MKFMTFAASRKKAIGAAILPGLLLVGLAALASACGSGSSEPGVGPTAQGGAGPAPAGVTTPRAYTGPDILLYAGTAAWSVEVASLKSIFDSHGLSYRAVTSAELDAMSVDDLATYGLIVWPGGEGGQQAKSLRPETHANLREAVQVRGVSYLGFCAGSFVAVAPGPAPGQDVSYGLGLVNLPELQYYYLENKLNPDITVVPAAFPDGSSESLLWYGGPVTPAIPHSVVARYPTGDAMISELWSGNGFVMLSAVHPAAPQSVRDQYGLVDPDGLDLDLAYRLISAALNQNPLPAF